MNRIVVALLGIGTLAVAGWYAVTHSSSSGRDPEVAAGSSQTLENVREAAHRIEDDQTKHLDDILEKTGQAAPSRE